jgi:hypothetical protein
VIGPFQGGFGAVGEGFVVDDRGVEGRDEFEQVGLTFDEVGEEIRFVRGQGAEERLLGLQLLAERAARVAVHESLQPARARRDATNMEIAWRGSSPDAGDSKSGAGNLPTEAPSGAFVSAPTQIELVSTASSRSACHPITTG